MSPNATEAAKRFATIVLACLALGAPRTTRAKLETWRQDTSSAFGKGHREGVVVSDAGVVRLGQRLQPTAKLEAARVWGLARTANGTLYAATGDAGKVFRLDTGKGHDAWTLAYDSDDTQALALAVLPDGRVFAGTGPSGRVVEVTDPKHPASQPEKGVQYIWDLAADAKGNLYAATGPKGQLWKRSAEGAWSLLLDSKHAHLLSVAVGTDGSVYTGSDGEGLVYKVRPDGSSSILYDAPQSDVRTLFIAPDGVLYAGTAAETGGGSGPGRSPSLFPGGSALTSATREPELEASTFAAQDRPKRPEMPQKPDSPARPSGPSMGGSASPRPSSPGENAVYRIDADGIAREVFRARSLIFALAWQEGRLLVGTGPEGQLFEVRDQGRESAPIARLDNGQILALLTEPDGNLLIGAGDPGSVSRLSHSRTSRGTLVSEVHDTKLISRFGALTWQADQPEGTSVSFQVRTGNVGEPDATWSSWSAEITDPGASKAEVPRGRFVQYRALLSSRVPAATPELRSVSLRYQSANLPPEINRLDVPDVGSGDGATRQTRLTLRWDVSDPNDDDLSYTLHVRKDGWPDWIALDDSPLTEKSFAWDTTALPAGVYRVRLTASDRPSNRPDDALSRSRESEPFLIDHEAPAVSLSARPRGAVATLKDNLTRLAKAAYAVDGGDWVAVFPDDGLFDTPRETITVDLPDLKPGSHVVVFRAFDAAGNVGTGDVLLHVK